VPEPLDLYNRIHLLINRGKIVKKLLLGGVLMLMGSGVFATEGGGSAYPHGAEGFMAGALPPPGQYFINYMLYYGANDFYDNSGNAMPIKFDLNVFVEAMRFINVTDKKILGGNWTQHIFIPLVNMDVDTPGGHDDAFGFGDIIVNPFILGWHTPSWHVAAGVDTFLPVGKYDKSDIANLGRNYWTIEPAVAVTWLNQAGYEVSAKFMYDFNLENNSTDYDSGDEFHMDYAVGKHLGAWTLGLGGFYYQQITGDDGTVMTLGGPVDAGDNKGQQFAWGPMVSYQYKGMSFVLKYQEEIETENRPEGGRVWFKFITAL
jgi:hypothetical protein